jgi:4-hydroxy-2-oxoheptanedioate aldolase
MILSDSAVVAEILALTGYGHILVDHEHSPTDIQSGQRILQAIESTWYCYSEAAAFRTEAIVRLPAHDPVYMEKMLDSMRLPGGVLVPMVNDVDIARAVVESTRYPKQQETLVEGRRNIHGGVRGCATPFVRASGWGRQDTASYLKQCEDDLLVLVQVETKAGVESIADIAQVEGIDGIFLGPMDLSCSIGKMGRFDDPEVQSLISRAEKAILRSGSLLAGFRSPGRDLKEMFDAGYSLICGSLDVGLLREAARQDLQAAQIFVNDGSERSA